MSAESQARADSTRFQGAGMDGCDHEWSAPNSDGTAECMKCPAWLAPSSSGPSRERLDRSAALTFDRFSEVNAQRCNRWHPGFPAPDAEGWSGADWSNAMLGEVGEAAEIFALFVAAAGKAGNIVKKLRRADCGLRGVLDPRPEGLREKLAAEIADVVTYADLLATYYGIDLGLGRGGEVQRRV